MGFNFKIRLEAFLIYVVNILHHTKLFVNLRFLLKIWIGSGNTAFGFYSAKVWYQKKMDLCKSSKVGFNTGCLLTSREASKLKDWEYCDTHYYGEWFRCIALMHLGRN